jgi:hypothetical protein
MEVAGGGEFQVADVWNKSYPWRRFLRDKNN